MSSEAAVSATTMMVHGLCVRIWSDDPALPLLVSRLLPVTEAASEQTDADVTYRVVHEGPDAITVIRDRRTLGVAATLADAAHGVVTDLQTTLARLAPGRIFLHAGVVAIDGRALVLPGASHAGKSTLVAALVAAGAQYGSDELAVVDADGLVHPYARPLALRRDGLAVLRTSAGELGGAAFEEAMPVGAFVFTTYTPGAQLELARVSPGQVVLRLLEHCLGARGRAGETLAVLSAVAGRAPGFAGARGEATETAETLLAWGCRGWA